MKQDVRHGKFNPTAIGSGNLTGIANSSGSIGGSGGSTSFQDFQESVDDAWDSGDDEFCTVSDVKISKRVSHSAALSVINSHRSGNKCSQLPQANAKSGQQEIIPEEKKAEALQRLAVQPLHLRNVNLHSQIINSQHSSEDVDLILKHSVSPQHKPTQFPGRPQPLRQTNAPNKFFIPSKEQGMYLFIVCLAATLKNPIEFKNRLYICSDGESKVDKFQLLLEASVLNLDELRQLSWSGVPAKLRSVTWRLLSVSREGKRIVEHDRTLSRNVKRLRSWHCRNTCRLI